MWNVRRRIRSSVALSAVLVGVFTSTIGADERGLVTFNGLPVPGATITITQLGRTFVVSTDADGRYEVAGLGDGREGRLEPGVPAPGRKLAPHGARGGRSDGVHQPTLLSLPVRLA